MGNSQQQRKQGDQGQGHGGGGPTYHLDIEGVIHEWNEPVITARQIAELGGWGVSQGVLEIDKKTNEQRQLQPDEDVELKPGMGYAKKHSWKRGDSVATRIEQELGLLASFYPEISYEPAGSWFLIPSYPVPVGGGWPEHLPVAFQAQSGHPGKAPYGIYVPAGTCVNGRKPTNYAEPARKQPPFDGRWGVLSWQPQSWLPKNDVTAGSNLLNFAQGFVERFRQGA